MFQRKPGREIAKLCFSPNNDRGVFRRKLYHLAIKPWKLNIRSGESRAPQETNKVRKRKRRTWSAKQVWPERRKKEKKTRHRRKTHFLSRHQPKSLSASVRSIFSGFRRGRPERTFFESVSVSPRARKVHRPAFIRAVDDYGPRERAFKIVARFCVGGQIEFRFCLRLPQIFCRIHFESCRRSVVFPNFKKIFLFFTKTVRSRL